MEKQQKQIVVSDPKVMGSEVLVLSDRDRDLFLSLLENSPEPCEALKSAMYKYQNKYENKLPNDE